MGISHSFYLRTEFIMETLENIGKEKIYDKNNKIVSENDILNTLNSIFWQKKDCKCDIDLLVKYIPDKYKYLLNIYF